MLCADALAVSRSSLNFLTFAHSRAMRFYIPGKCGPGTYRRMRNGPMKATPDNTTLLLLEKPEAEVRVLYEVMNCVSTYSNSDLPR